MLKLAICVILCTAFVRCQGNPLPQNDQAPNNGFGSLFDFPSRFVNSAMGGMGKMVSGVGTAVSGVGEAGGAMGHNMAAMITSAAQGVDGITKRITHVISDVDGKRTEQTFQN